MRVPVGLSAPGQSLRDWSRVRVLPSALRRSLGAVLVVVQTRCQLAHGSTAESVVQFQFEMVFCLLVRCEPPLGFGDFRFKFEVRGRRHCSDHSAWSIISEQRAS